MVFPIQVGLFSRQLEIPDWNFRQTNERHIRRVSKILKHENEWILLERRRGEGKNWEVITKTWGMHAVHAMKSPS